MKAIHDGAKVAEEKIIRKFTTKLESVKEEQQAKLKKQSVSVVEQQLDDIIRNK